MKTKGTIFCFGEVLWDLFQDGKKIGGAPLNVALRLHSYGYDANVISRVGQDKLGKEIICFFEKKALSLNFLQKDELFSTGTVAVEIDKEGVATYEISSPAAWDNIALTSVLQEAVFQSDIFLFGSLALRSPKSRKTLQVLLKNAKLKVFDVNLRPPFYSYTLLMELMLASDLIKCNEEELLEIAMNFGTKEKSLESCIAFLAEKTKTKQICVTLGAKGALLYLHGNVYRQKGFTVEVQDTVGAGDSFLATLLDGILRKGHPQKILQRACAVGALVSSKAGANPSLKEEDIHALLTTASA